MERNTTHYVLLLTPNGAVATAMKFWDNEGAISTSWKGVPVVRHYLSEVQACYTIKPTHKDRCLVYTARSAEFRENAGQY
jgi:hypothetical protein